ncbi:MAG: GlxA family transcriptional regulator [Hydrogenophaga sp.]|jgi:transcriptional regulator GlxA family with amidase domain|uniref:GlxA family transcriptional regulator n=1 Tax=Hydrogenophaga sp. TaxID=1904254 RepID=UPI001DC78BDF|nr:helix-turn-helix domain-containing protein [Hydrogenophaga sp.]MBW0169943.1 helix-turn-helix domain-containing protein [Hydrogenophaga sp.]MBW0183082.1 helix-turn-helix domain-containing protein [Hydrogenophaga sp.]
MRIHILVLDGVFDLGLSALTDTLGTARQLAGLLAEPPTTIEVTLVGVRRRVRTAQGLTVPVVPVHSVHNPDVVLVPALGANMPDTLAARLARADVADAIVAMRRWSTSTAVVGAACTGTFLLAESALLDGQRATTSWWLAPMFRQRYPRVALDDSRMLVSSAGFTTAGAAMAHVDLALGIVRSSSPALAAQTARYLLVEPRGSQAEFVIPDHLAHADPVVERFEGWARQRLAHGFSLAEAAVAVGASERTLARRLQGVLGKSPLSYFQDLRVERAVHLLRTSTESVDQIAARIGYSDGVTLRALLRRKLGRGVRELRAET